jgi:hypothetical protein
VTYFVLYWFYVTCPVLLWSFVCCDLFERGVLVCAICVFLCVVSYCSTTATGKPPFAVKLNNNNNIPADRNLRNPRRENRKSHNKRLPCEASCSGISAQKGPWMYDNHSLHRASGRCKIPQRTLIRSTGSRSTPPSRGEKWSPVDIPLETLASFSYFWQWLHRRTSAGALSGSCRSRNLSFFFRS